MNFILYSDVNDHSISQSLGRPEYSYYFVLKAYRPVLESLGPVHVVSSVAEVDPLYRTLQQAGQDCLFLSFSPPHKTPQDLLCPMVCVVAWEFDSIPAEHWDDDLRHDWSRTLARHGRVITLSSHTAEAIRRTLGEDFPVLVLPTPLWERFAAVRERHPSLPVNPGATLQIKGCIIDSRPLGLSADGLIAPILEEVPEPEPEPIVEPPPLTWRRRAFISRHYLREVIRAFTGKREQGPVWLCKHNLLCWYREAVRDLVPVPVRVATSRILRGPAALPVAVEPVPEPSPEPAAPAHPQAVLPDTHQVVETEVSGVVYVSVFNPDDGRKNWHQLVTAFCWALRDVEDATLVLKMTQNDLSTYYVELLTLLSQLSPFSCRVVVMHGYLEDEQFARLYGAASFYVNASRCEGLCLPLMEFMSCARPVIAPDHTAMRDYIDAEVAFIVKSSREPTIWPEDSRILYRTLRHRPDWGSLKLAYQQSYAMAKHQPQAYQAMAAAANERMRRYCAFAPVQRRLADFLAEPGCDEGLPLAVQAGSASC
ncbi:Glycosyltransferase involved in cell wall bisynthesis [Pseudomonas sp. NFACC15-1]|uniref:glycosyltransferase n=1 Tax=unclassified Pseudomonas TaxID=196821 RepID=UPI00087F176A|nr:MULTISPECIES: glycosyltransferase [unclassified Pseudomonas]SDA60443.1 Glycosyltransferase involved in cell wall bisynthesis [Pseudomonas sp. NFACC15-1]SDX83180.1 Glycosyltransferase involved in cell wall bisynthesis [Pseudomonas sp. NFACC14]